MKIKAIVSVTASAIALCAAGQVLAHPSGFLEPFNAADIAAATQVKMGGATAQDKGLVLLMRRLCATGTMTRVVGNKQTAMMCHANGADSLPIAAGTHLVLWKNSDGGSGTGVLPVSQRTTLPFLNLASLTQAQYTTPATCTVTNVASTTDFAGYKEYNCKTNIGTVAMVPDAGISDVEPSLLGYASGVHGAMSIMSGPQVLFGLPVSKKFRNALQGGTFPPASVCNPANAAYAANADTEPCMPALTKAQIGSMFTGALIPVNRLSDINTGVPLAAPSAAPLGTVINICRRKEGSGTLASTKAYFLNVPCDKSSKDMTNGVDGDAGAPVLPASRVIAYSGTTGVLGCLNAKDAANQYAIGMASMETKADGTAYVGDVKWGTDPGNWRFVKILGQAPILLDTVQTKYDFLMEATYQYRIAPNLSLPTAAQVAFITKIKDTNSTAVVIKELNTAFVHSFGQSGLLGVPGTPTAPSGGGAGPLTAAEVTANPVNTWGRGLANNKPNSCQPPFVTKETAIDP